MVTPVQCFTAGITPVTTILRKAARKGKLQVNKSQCQHIRDELEHFLGDQG